MGWKWVGVDGKGYANTTYISEFHPQILAGRIFQKKGLPAAAESRPPPPDSPFCWPPWLSMLIHAPDLVATLKVDPIYTYVRAI